MLEEGPPSVTIYAPCVTTGVVDERRAPTRRTAVPLPAPAPGGTRAPTKGTRTWVPHPAVAAIRLAVRRALHDILSEHAAGPSAPAPA
ncbi:hypothetical protein GA0115252_14571, partial [Streptomyces sp. DfronAA-171]